MCDMKTTHLLRNVTIRRLLPPHPLTPSDNDIKLLCLTKLYITYCEIIIFFYWVDIKFPGFPGKGIPQNSDPNEIFCFLNLGII